MARLCLFPTTAEQLAKSFRSEFIYTPTMEAKWAKVLVLPAAASRPILHFGQSTLGDPSDPKSRP